VLTKIYEQLHIISMKKIISTLFGMKQGNKKNSKDHACGEAFAEQCFWVHDGPILKDMLGLVQALQTMSDEQFDYHTKREGNDFARWVADVLEDVSCASAVKRTRTRAGMLKALARHIS